MAKIACVGSRSLTGEQETICEKLGAWIVSCSHELHTGAAVSADQSFARGANQVDPALVHLHLPWLSYERESIVLGNHVDIFPSLDQKTQQVYLDYAKVHHPAWGRLSQGAQKLHARNGRIIFPNGYPGKPVDLVIAWPSKKIGGGGTGMGMRMAEAEGIPLVDLSKLQDQQRELHNLCERIKEMK